MFKGLIIEYEKALTRRNSINNKYYDQSAHMLWIGYRTLQTDSSHVEFFRGVENPIGLKVGPKITQSEFVEILKMINPLNLKGKIMVILRFGADNVQTILKDLILSKQQNQLNFIWMCDPMHGNTFNANNFKTRSVEAIKKVESINYLKFDLSHKCFSLSALTITSVNANFINLKINYQEINLVQSTLKENNESLGGLHLETSPKDVTECVGGIMHIQGFYKRFGRMI